MPNKPRIGVLAYPFHPSTHLYSFSGFELFRGLLPLISTSCGPLCAFEKLSRASRLLGSLGGLVASRALSPPASDCYFNFFGATTGEAGREPHRTTARRARNTKLLGLGFLNNTCESQKSRATAPAPGGAARALHNSLSLHRRTSSKRWCEWLPGVDTV